MRVVMTFVSFHKLIIVALIFETKKLYFDSLSQRQRIGSALGWPSLQGQLWRNFVFLLLENFVFHV